MARLLATKFGHDVDDKSRVRPAVLATAVSRRLPTISLSTSTTKCLARALGGDGATLAR